MAKDKRSFDDDELISTHRRRKSRGEKRGSDAQSTNVSRRRQVKVDFGSDERPVNGYYMAVSSRYRAAKIVSFLLLIVFLAVMLIFYRGSITYSNLMYLVRDLNTGSTVAPSAFADISYDEQYRASFALYRSHIALLSSSGFRLYSTTGTEEINDNLSLTSPVMDVGNKYALVYDSDGTKYCIYTALSRVLSSQTEEIIEDGCVSDDGHYALMTRSDDSKFKITVYDDGFRALTNYYKDKYVVDMALSEDGGEIAVVSATVLSSDISAEIMIGKVGTEDSKTLNIDGQMPIYCRYAEDGTLWVLTDKALIAVVDGEVSWQKEFEYVIPSVFDAEGNIFAIACAKNTIGSENEIFIFDTAGNILYNDSIEKKLVSIVSDGENAVYTVGEGSADMIILPSKDKKAKVKSTEVDGGVLDALAVPGSLIVCRPDGTTSLFVGE